MCICIVFLGCGRAGRKAEQSKQSKAKQRWPSIDASKSVLPVFHRLVPLANHLITTPFSVDFFPSAALRHKTSPHSDFVNSSAKTIASATSRDAYAYALPRIVLDAQPDRAAGHAMAWAKCQRLSLVHSQSSPRCISYLASQAILAPHCLPPSPHAPLPILRKLFVEEPFPTPPKTSR
ncbi:hypothetical protein CCHR01_09712 [Colletotrichum chrysophilum]|uniref:Uncharacterized protein n=1 Tax=Colletotrichum chrysophilum TaxID=1836956 RepID=A0AAD9AHZ6_9PEZI|nr:hypothetical protein CCHR01_09712 [Colletotrichum chrysophilum]